MSENIVAARTAWERSVRKLCRPRPAVYHDTTVYVPSLYDALVSEKAGAQGDTRTPAKSLPPLWLDAVLLVQEIDTQTRKWMPKPGTTPQRLDMLTERSWRPQDTDEVRDMSRRVEGWCESIVNLLDPESRKFIEGASCPSCGKRIVYRKDSAGEQVRQPALKVVMSQGCTCQACGAFWAPDRFLFLGRLLGYELPEGVLE